MVQGQDRSGRARGAFEVKTRLEEMDAKGVAGDLIFCTALTGTSPFFDVINRPHPAELRAAGAWDGIAIIDELGQFLPMLNERNLEEGVTAPFSLEKDSVGGVAVGLLQVLEVDLRGPAACESSDTIRSGSTGTPTAVNVAKD